jgi:tetratricopeptide (TPR) repeat protein
MRRIVLLIFALIAFFQILPVASAFDQDDEIPWLALQGQELIFARRYDDALTFFKHVEEQYPDAALGPFGLMAAYEVQMLEREDFHLENEFLATAKRGEEITRRIMQRYHPGDVDLFFCGGLIGLEGFFKARKGQWWGAYTRGNISRQIFTSIRKQNPNFVDATFGLGMYTYWRSVFTKEISFLPFFADKRKEGIEIVERVAQEGNLAREMAHVNLGIIYFEEKRYADAIRVFQEFVERYPNNIILHNFLGRIFLADKQYDRAIFEFQKVATLDPSIAKAQYFIGTALVLQGKKERFPEAETELQGFLAKTTDRLWRSYTLYWLGTLKEKQGDNEKAKDYYEKAFELNHGLKSAQLKLRGLGGGL